MTALLTTLAATCIILSRAAQIDRVRIYQSPESTEVQRQEAMTELVGANVRLAHKVAKQHVRKGLESSLRGHRLRGDQVRLHQQGQLHDLREAVDARQVSRARPG
jgi:hypothetical protein